MFPAMTVLRFPKKLVRETLFYLLLRWSLSFSLWRFSLLSFSPLSLFSFPFSLYYHPLSIAFLLFCFFLCLLCLSLTLCLSLSLSPSLSLSVSESLSITPSLHSLLAQGYIPSRHAAWKKLHERKNKPLLDVSLVDDNLVPLYVKRTPLLLLSSPLTFFLLSLISTLRNLFDLNVL